MLCEDADAMRFFGNVLALLVDPDHKNLRMTTTANPSRGMGHGEWEHICRLIAGTVKPSVRWIQERLLMLTMRLVSVATVAATLPDYSAEEKQGIKFFLTEKNSAVLSKGKGTTSSAQLLRRETPTILQEVANVFMHAAMEEGATADDVRGWVKDGDAADGVDTTDETRGLSCWRTADRLVQLVRGRDCVSSTLVPQLLALCVAAFKQKQPKTSPVSALRDSWVFVLELLGKATMTEKAATLVPELAGVLVMASVERGDDAAFVIRCWKRAVGVLADARLPNAAAGLLRTLVEAQMADVEPVGDPFTVVGIWDSTIKRLKKANLTEKATSLITILAEVHATATTGDGSAVGLPNYDFALENLDKLKIGGLMTVSAKLQALVGLSRPPATQGDAVSRLEGWMVELRLLEGALAVDLHLIAIVKGMQLQHNISNAELGRRLTEFAGEQITGSVVGRWLAGGESIGQRRPWNGWPTNDIVRGYMLQMYPQLCSPSLLSTQPSPLPVQIHSPVFGSENSTSSDGGSDRGSDSGSGSGSGSASGSVNNRSSDFDTKRTREYMSTMNWTDALPCDEPVWSPYPSPPNFNY